MAVRDMFMAAAVARLEEQKRVEQRKKRASRNDQSRGSKYKRGYIMMALFGIFPLLAIPVIIYNIIALGKGGFGAVSVEAGAATALESGTVVSPMMETMNSVMIEVSMIGGVVWEVTSGDLLILLAIGFLFMELLKSTSTGTATIMNHAVSMLLFIVCLIEFLLFPNFATSVFFILTVMTLLDVLAGVVVTIVSARRDFAVGGGFGG